MQVAILRIVIVSLALLVGVSTAGADRGTARASSARPKARARISARSLPRIDSVKSGTGKLEAKLRSGRHKLAVTKDESATIRVERGTKAKVKYRLGRDGRIKSADITLNKSVEVRNGARAAASAMTRSRGFLLRTAARFTTAFVNPWVRVRKFKLTGDRRGGLRLTPHFEGDLGMLRVPVEMSLPVDASTISFPVSGGAGVLSRLVGGVAGDFDISAVAGNGPLKLSGNYRGRPTSRGFDLGDGASVTIEGSGIRGQFEIKGQLELQ